MRVSLQLASAILLCATFTSLSHAGARTPISIPEGIYLPEHLRTPAERAAALQSGILEGLDSPPYIEFAAHGFDGDNAPELRTMFRNFPAGPMFNAVQRVCYTTTGLRFVMNDSCEPDSEDAAQVNFHFELKQSPLRLECTECAREGLPARWIFDHKQPSPAATR